MNPAPANLNATLLPAVASCDSTFRLMEHLMRFCRDQAAAFRTWDDNPASKADVRAANDEARRIVTDEIGTVFAPDDDPVKLAHIRTAVAGYLGEVVPPPVVRAELLLRELDRAFLANLRALYPDFQPGPLAPGGLFPVYWPNLKGNGWFPADKLSPQPASMSPPPGFLTKWALAPSADAFSGRQVELVFPARTDVSSPLTGALNLGVGILNAERGELVWEEDIGPPPLFRNVRPRPDIRDRQVAAMCSIATRAASEGVRVLVFPELCVDQSGADEVFRHIATLNAPPALVVIGSYHWLDGATRRNTCTAFRTGTASPLHHHKIAPFSYRQGNQTFREDIRSGDTVRVYVGTDWSVVLLICRDFLDASLRPLVEALRPTFLCVPSFSQTTPFVDLAGAITASSQTVVVFANGPVPLDRVTAVFGVPRVREEHSSGAALARQSVMPEPLPALPCLVVYSGINDAIRHLPC